MQVRELTVPDTYEFTPERFGDRRGAFVAPFQEAAFLEARGHPLRVAQTNHSVSAAGVIRGVHFADTPPGQAKYVYCPRGALLDVVVDLRLGSPTFGAWDAVRLDDQDCRAVYVAEGIGHAIMALTDDTAASYLCSAAYNPDAEHGIDPLDESLDLPWPPEFEPLLSDRDRAAPTLKEAEQAGMLPRYADCLAHYEQLRVTSSG